MILVTFGARWRPRLRTRTAAAARSLLKCDRVPADRGACGSGCVRQRLLPGNQLPESVPVISKIGTSTTMVVPWPGVASTAAVPPAISARS